MIKSCNHSAKVLCGSCEEKNHIEKLFDEKDNRIRKLESRHAELLELVGWYLQILSFCNDTSPITVNRWAWDEIVESLYEAETALRDFVGEVK